MCCQNGRSQCPGQAGKGGMGLSEGEGGELEVCVICRQQGTFPGTGDVREQASRRPVPRTMENTKTAVSAHWIWDVSPLHFFVCFVPARAIKARSRALSGDPLTAFNLFAAAFSFMVKRYLVWDGLHAQEVSGLKRFRMGSAFARGGRAFSCTPRGRGGGGGSRRVRRPASPGRWRGTNFFD